MGETSRTLGERGREHWEDARNNKEESHMVAHQREAHPGSELSSEFKIVRSCRSALERQVSESIAIKLAIKRGTMVTNSKIEFNRCLLPTLEVVGPTRKPEVEQKPNASFCVERELTRKAEVQEHGALKKLKLDDAPDDAPDAARSSSDAKMVRTSVGRGEA